MKNLLLIVAVLLSFSWKNKEKIYHVKGETITFTGVQNSQLVHDNINNVDLYLILPNREKIELIEGKDYTRVNNAIRRTNNSVIPDFSAYKVKYLENGKFKWIPEPKRNPELTIGYQVYADYTFTALSKQIGPNKTSHKVNSCLQSGRKLKMAYIGTSISCGIDTYEMYYHNNPSQTYPHLIAKAIKYIYNIDVDLINKSVNGGGVYIIQDINHILTEQPDVVIIELGMNDHTGANPSLENFSQSIENAIANFKSKGIEVLLVGFFQQNPEWNLEYSENTVKFNEALKEIALQNDLYFADIYNSFKNFTHQKLYCDLMGDYIHHPTSFGHQLYYLEIMPYFLRKQVDKYALLKYIYL